jgi:hypothetical protein
MNTWLVFGRIGSRSRECVKSMLAKTVEISDCFDPAYLVALLIDSRIRGADW